MLSLISVQSYGVWRSKTWQAYSYVALTTHWYSTSRFTWPQRRSRTSGHFDRAATTTEKAQFCRGLLISMPDAGRDEDFAHVDDLGEATRVFD